VHLTHKDDDDDASSPETQKTIISQKVFPTFEKSKKKAKKKAKKRALKDKRRHLSLSLSLLFTLSFSLFCTASTSLSKTRLLKDDDARTRAVIAPRLRSIFQLRFIAIFACSFHVVVVVVVERNNHLHDDEDDTLVQRGATTLRLHF
jgi:hypothetical protein